MCESRYFNWFAVIESADCLGTENVRQEIADARSTTSWATLERWRAYTASKFLAG
jgi:hypothetical protein